MANTTRNHVYIDVRSLLDHNISGIGRYVQGLLLALQELVSENEYNTTIFHLLTPTSSNFSRLRAFNKNNFPLLKLPINHILMNYLVNFNLFPPIDIFLKKGIFIFPNYAGPPIMRSKSITFVYDLSFIIVPEYVDKGNRLYLTKKVKHSINNSEHIITISESSKRDIVKHYNINPDKVSIIYPAIDHNKYTKEQQQAIEKIKINCGIKNDYLLFVGNIEPRKNLVGIIKAYMKLDSGLRNKTSLLIVGGSGWLNKEILKMIAGYQSKGADIILPAKYINDDELPALYSGADLFLFPSHYEGFGIPLLEAMACGTPIVTSPNSSLPEVAGDAAYYVNPNDPVDIAAGITRVLRDEVLRRSLVEKGLKRVRQFTWRNSAEKFHELIKKSIREM
ncbi:MAG: glycosyltransferase family 1 protein [bacterium]|nr:glycosyltransferase family 1 protein [bacterium]